MRVYIAGPLFTKGERVFCRQVKDIITQAGLTPVWPWEITNQAQLNGDKGGGRRIFDSNLTELKKSELVVAILDGPDVDSGTAWELGYAYSNKIPAVGIRTDFRKAGDAANAIVNLMVHESMMEVITNVDHLKAKLECIKKSKEIQDQLTEYQ